MCQKTLLRLDALVVLLLREDVTEAMLVEQRNSSVLDCGLRSVCVTIGVRGHLYTLIIVDQLAHLIVHQFFSIVVDHHAPV